MAKQCPITGKPVIYLTCLECTEKKCKEIKVKTSSQKETNTDKNIKNKIGAR